MGHAAALTDLIHKEVAVSLEGVYATLGFPTVGLVTELEVQCEDVDNVMLHNELKMN